MEIGVAEPITEEEPAGARRAGSSREKGRTGKGGGKNNNGGGDNNNGGPGGGNDGIDRSSETNGKDKTRIVTWFLLLVVAMTFGALMGAYVVIATNDSIEWRPFALPFQIWISTSLILISTLSYELARKAIGRADLKQTRFYFGATAVLGAMFISSQLMVWKELTARGLYMAGNPYAGFFYILTAAHALHVVGGIVALSVILLRSWHPTSDEAEAKYRVDLSKAIGWYWHFMALLWIALVALLGFWT